MKSKILLTMSSVLLATALVGCGGGNSSSSEPSKESGNSSEVPSQASSESIKQDESSEEEVIIPGDIASLLENLEDYNFTATCGNEENGVYMTFYGLGHDAFYIDFAADSISDYGNIAHGDDVYSFAIEGGEVVVLSWLGTLEEGTTIYDYIYHPLDFTLFEFSDEGDGEYSSTDSDLKESFAINAGLEKEDASGIDEIYLSIPSGNESAELNAVCSTDMGDLTLKIDLFDFGDTELGPIDLILAGEEDLALPQWPEEDIATLLEIVCGYTETTIPAIEGKDYYTMPFMLAASYGYGFVGVYGIGDQTLEYATGLIDACWSIRANGDFLSPTGDVEVSLQYNGNEDIFYIAFAQPTILEFPVSDAEEIVQYLVPDSETVIPVFEGADQYGLFSDNEIDAYTDDLTLGEAYVSTLIGAGWTLTDDGYLSPEGDIMLTLEYNEEYNCFEIVLSAFNGVFENWPSILAADYLGENVTDTLPAFAGDNNGFVVTKYVNECRINVLVEEGTASEAISRYFSILIAEGWQQQGPIDFASPNGQIFCEIGQTISGNVSIGFYKDPWLDALESFPLDKVNQFLSTNGFDLSFPSDTNPTDPTGDGYVLIENTTDEWTLMTVEVKDNAYTQWCEQFVGHLAAVFELQGNYDYGSSAGIQYGDSYKTILIYYDGEITRIQMVLYYVG